MRRSVATSDGISNWSRRSSRYVSSSAGNDPKRDATARRSAARFRCCHNGVRVPGRRRGRRSARAAVSRNRAAKSDVDPSWRITSPSTSSASGTSSIGSGGLSTSGKRMTNPSSPHITSTSMPVRFRMCAVTAIAQGAWIRLPSGDSRHTRQSPSSSRHRSMTMTRSSGTAPAAAWSSR